MIIDEHSFVEYIIAECKKIQAEVLIERAFFNEQNEEPKCDDPLQLLQYLDTVRKKNQEFDKMLQYKSGKFDAYLEILKFLKVIE